MTITPTAVLVGVTWVWLMVMLVVMLYLADKRLTRTIAALERAQLSSRRLEDELRKYGL